MLIQTSSSSSFVSRAIILFCHIRVVICVWDARLPCPANSWLHSLLCVLFMQMTKHAWDSYRQYGWGHNELKPLAKKGHSTNIFGKSDRAPLSAVSLPSGKSHIGACMSAHTLRRAPTHTHTGCVSSRGQGYVMMPPAGCISLWGKC